MRDFPRFLLIGIASGWIAAILARGSVRLRGCITYGFVGVLGASTGGYAGMAVGFGEVARVFTAALGAVVLLSLIRTLRSR